MRRRFQPDCLYLRIFLSPLQGWICSGLTTQGGARVASLALVYFLFALSGLGFVSFIHEQFPVSDAVRVTNERR